MEHDVAILMADLSGYTAMTETHGPSGAADLVDTYLSIAYKCLEGDCKIHQCIGDEVMIVSSSADDLIKTAISLIENTSRLHNFLQVHGGMHFGKVIKRNENYFGSAVNLTARITSAAGSGCYWCSRDFVDALTDKAAFTFEPRGKHTFKNVSEENEILELILFHEKPSYIDPVCRMQINEKENAIQHPDNPGIYFCSVECLNVFTGK